MCKYVLVNSSNIKKPNEEQKQDSSRMSSWTEFVVQYHCQDEHEVGSKETA